MPTKDEVVKALLCGASKKEKDLCERSKREFGCTRCIKTYMHDTIDLIEQQERQIQQLTEALLLANANFEHAKRERDAAIADLYKAKSCDTCAKQYKDDCLLEECMDPCSTFAEGYVPYKWHRVEDKMPERFVSVLGYVPDQTPFPTVRECWYVGDSGWYFPALMEMCQITHWAEMPEFEEEV